MPDIVDPKTRSRLMSGIRSKNTKPEILVRRGLHARGFRFRLHSAKVLGKPDLVLARYNAAVFVNGCFWHGHNCHLFKMPGTRTEFWQTKIERNRVRDAEVRKALLIAGWRRLVVWECALKGKTHLDFEELMIRVSNWIVGDKPEFEISGEQI